MDQAAGLWSKVELRLNIQSCFTVDGTARLYIMKPHEAWSRGIAYPSSVDLSNPGIEPRSPALQADYLPAK